MEEDLMGMKIIGWRAKVEDREEWNRIVVQTETHPGLQSQQKKKKKKKKITHILYTGCAKIKFPAPKG